MKSIEFVLPESIGGIAVPGDWFSRFVESLTAEFGGYTQRNGRKFWRDGNGKMLEEKVLIYEVAFGGANLDGIGRFARPFAAELKTSIEVKIDGDTLLIDAVESPKAVDEKAVISDFPAQFDVAVQTVIGPELHAAQDVFQATGDGNVRSFYGTQYYRGQVVQGRGPVSVVICCQSGAGNDAAALMAERIINRWNPKAIFLMGICAGRKGKCKIGDVVTPRVIVDDNEGVMEAKGRLGRPNIYPPPHAMVQQLQNFRPDSVRSEWISNLKRLMEVPKPAPKKKKLYRKLVSESPSHFEAAIYSSDLLLRDGEFLEKQSVTLHQQIRIGEMEAAGFSTACNARTPVVPWFVVRGVSDFGDEFKDDAFHKWAAYAAATYLYSLIKDGINVGLFN
jgi:nucleoside phosphorylase